MLDIQTHSLAASGMIKCLVHAFLYNFYFHSNKYFNPQHPVKWTNRVYKIWEKRRLPCFQAQMLAEWAELKSSHCNKNKGEEDNVFFAFCLATDLKGRQQLSGNGFITRSRKPAFDKRVWKELTLKYGQPSFCSSALQQVLNSYKGGTGKGSWESSKNSFNYYTVRPFVQQID